MTFIVSICQVHCKSEHKQVKWNKIKRDILESDSIFPYLQSITVFQWLSKLINNKNKIITVPEEKCHNLILFCKCQRK